MGIDVCPPQVIKLTSLGILYWLKYGTTYFPNVDGVKLI